MLDDEPEDVRKLRLEIALLDLEMKLLEASQASHDAHRRNPNISSSTLINDWITIHEAIKLNHDLAWDSPQKWHTIPELMAATIGVVGFDEGANAIVDVARIVPATRRLLAGNNVFQDLANGYFQETYSVTLPFTHSGKLLPSDISPLSPMKMRHN
jgi:hypothetical protein